jgi:Tol biopolymer transport system component
MRSDFDPDRLISDWLDDAAPMRAPDELLGQVLGRTRETRRRPGWIIPERWLPMALFLRPRSYARMAGVAALMILATLLAVAGVVGSQPDRKPAPPFGLARNGLIAFGSDGQLYVSEADGADPRPFVADPMAEASVPKWSLDGTRLAYLSTASTATSPSLVILDADGTNQRVLVADLPCGTACDFAWAPDGDRIMYWASSGGDIYAVSLEGDAPVLLYRSAPAGGNPAWSPHGERIAFRGIAEGAGVYVAEADGSGDATRISRAVGEEGAFADVQWSPDGTLLAYRAGGPSDFKIYVADADGSDEHRLTASTSDVEMFPSWSPTGSRLIYERMIPDQADSNGTPSFELTVIGADGTGPIALRTDPLAPGSAAWSPDEDRLEVGTSSGAYLVDMAGDQASVPIPEFGDWQRLAP